MYVGVCEGTREAYPGVDAALLRTRFIELQVDAAPTEIKEKLFYPAGQVLFCRVLPCAEDASGPLSGCITAKLYRERDVSVFQRIMLYM